MVGKYCESEFAQKLGKSYYCPFCLDLLVKKIGYSFLYCFKCDKKVFLESVTEKK